jgi:Flp pilus assembly pilin Flp
MLVASYARMWVREKLGRDEEGEAATEYVLVMLGVALFLVFAAFTLNGVSGGPTNAIKNWITTVSLPPAP